MRLRAGWRGAMIGLKMLPAGLAAQGDPLEVTQVHLGMPVRIAVVADSTAPAAVAPRAIEQAFARMAALEDVFSDWRPQSELRRLEQAPVGAWQPVSPELFVVLQFALELAAATEGAFDPTIGPLTRLWREAVARARPIADAEREAARARVGFRAVQLDATTRRIRLLRPGVQFDLGAVAKGYIVDQALLVLREAGLRGALVEAGGEIAAFGAPHGHDGWRVGVGATVLTLKDGAISSSGSETQRLALPGQAPESHVLRPGSGRGLEAAASVTVRGPRAMVTDALATAVSLVTAEQAQALARTYRVTIVGR